MSFDRRRLDELWTRHLAGAPLSDDDRRALLDAAIADDALATELALDERAHHEVGSLARSARDEDAFVAAVARRLESPPVARRRRPLVFAMVAVPLAVAAAVVLLARPRPPAPVEDTVVATESHTASRPAARPAPAAAAAATVTAARGDAYAIRDGEKLPLRAGDALAAGEAIATSGSQSGATVTVAGSRFDVGPDTTLAPVAVAAGHPTTVFVATGVVHAQTHRGAVTLRILTPHAEATSPAGAFTVRVADGKTRLEVAAGAAQFRGNRQHAPSAVSAGQHALTAAEGEDDGAVIVDRTRRRRALFVVGRVPPTNPADRIVLARLQSLDFDVVTRAGASAGLEDEARAAALVAISSTVDSATLGALFKDLPVPVVAWEPALYDDLGLTGPPDPDVQGALPASEILIASAEHPLAAGLTGRVRIADRIGNHYVSQGTPAPTAHWIATMPGDPTRATIFAYERGTPMVELTAPARRVALFVSDLTPPHMTRQGWALFDAAARWAAGDAP